MKNELPITFEEIEARCYLEARKLIPDPPIGGGQDAWKAYEDALYEIDDLALEFEDISSNTVLEWEDWIKDESSSMQIVDIMGAMQRDKTYEICLYNEVMNDPTYGIYGIAKEMTFNYLKEQFRWRIKQLVQSHIKLVNSKLDKNKNNEC